MSIYPSEILSRNLSIQLNYYQAGFWDQEWNLQQYKKCSITNSWSALTGEMKVPTFTEGLWLPVSQSNEVSEQLSVLLRLFLSNKYLILHRVEFKHHLSSLPIPIWPPNSERGTRECLHSPFLSISQACRQDTTFDCAVSSKGRWSILEAKK